jgi:hypothetical protein
MKKRMIEWILKPMQRVLVVVGAVVVILALLGSPLGSGLVQGIWKSLENLTARVTSTRPLSPVIVKQLQALNRLETAKQTNSHTIEAESHANIFPSLTSESLVLIAQTEVTAGVDLAQLKSEDVQVKGSSVRIRLPEPKVLNVQVDDLHTRVYRRDKGLFVWHPDKDLERQARLQASFEARQAARANGLLHIARMNAEDNLRSLLKSLGFEQVEFAT